LNRADHMGGQGSGPQTNTERDKEIVRLREQGLTLAEIGRRFGLTRQAVDYILKRMRGPQPSATGPRGLAAVSPERRREIGSKGGRAAQARGTAHRFTSAEAAAAGRKGGKAAQAKGTAHRFTVEEARAAGKKGGRRRKEKRR
jgi:general stress protein YciG